MTAELMHACASNDLEMKSNTKGSDAESRQVDNVGRRTVFFTKSFSLGDMQRSLCYIHGYNSTVLPLT